MTMIQHLFSFKPERVFLLTFTCFAIVLSSCGGDEEDEKLPELPANANAVEKMRAEKDRYFKSDTNSPLPSEKRKSFGGLSYFKYDDKYAVIASFEAASKPDTLRMPASQGDIRIMIRVGVFSFSVGDDEKVCHLAGYRNADNSSSTIIIPFKDKTTGGTTYEAGRYVEIEESGGDEYTIDFNTAYNPYCAFNENFSCLLVPAQNVLPISINAGEKTFQIHSKGQKK